MKEAKTLLKEIEKDIKTMLSEKRYCHSIGVMHKAEELAKKYNIDVEKAKIVGLAHDIAKELPKAEKLKYVEEHHIKIDEVERVNIELLHAKIGADMCKKRYGFSQDMQDAIRFHTTGNPNMDDLAKIILIADKTEAGRKNIDFAEIKELEKKGLNAEVVYLLDKSIVYTIKKGGLIHPDSVYTRNQLFR